MKSAPLPPDEEARLQSLQQHQLLDTLPEEVFDDVTKLASEICGTPIALLTLVDEKRQWFKSKQGLHVDETSREDSFCAHTILNPDEVLVVPDARYDERFHDNPLTTGEPHVVFYAGVPVKDADGHALGSLCVIDNRPRELSDDKLESLKALAKLVNAHFKLRRMNLQLEATQKELRQKNEALKTVATGLVQLANGNASAEQQQQIATLQQAIQHLP